MGNENMMLEIIAEIKRIREDLVKGYRINNNGYPYYARQMVGLNEFELKEIILKIDDIIIKHTKE